MMRVTSVARSERAFRKRSRRKLRCDCVVPGTPARVLVRVPFELAEPPPRVVRVARAPVAPRLERRLQPHNLPVSIGDGPPRVVQLPLLRRQALQQLRPRRVATLVQVRI